MAQTKDRNTRSVGRRVEQPDLLYPAAAGAGTGRLINFLEKSIKAAHMHTPDSRAYIHPRNAYTPPREIHKQPEKCINSLPREKHIQPPRETCPSVSTAALFVLVPSGEVSKSTRTAEQMTHCGLHSVGNAPSALRRPTPALGDNGCVTGEG